MVDSSVAPSTLVRPTNARAKVVHPDGFRTMGPQAALPSRVNLPTHNI